MKIPKYVKARPQVVRVFGRNFLIDFVDSNALGTQAVGLCQNDQFIITILEGQHPVEEFDTVLHELMHAVWFVQSAALGGADEEQIVRRISTGLTGVFMDNPTLLAYFNEIRKLCNEPS